MLEIIRHRVNEKAALAGLDAAFGTEIDIRSRGGRLILAHDPSSVGDSLEEYLEAYAKTRPGQLLILNVKEDGHEMVILRLLAQHHLERFFFLDTALPTLVRLTTKQKERRVAVRVSEYEPVEYAERFSGLAEWVWVDCFTGVPPAMDIVRRLHRSFKVCLVSPELQGYPAERIADFKSLSSEADAVCTKDPARWR